MVQSELNAAREALEQVRRARQSLQNIYGDDRTTETDSALTALQKAEAQLRWLVGLDQSSAAPATRSKR